MLRPLAIVCSIFALATPAFATCGGQDLRHTLNAQQQQELETAVANTPYANGNHWTATKGEKKIVLIGTIHIGDPRLRGPVERLKPIVQSAGMLLLEANDEDEADLKKRLSSDPSMFMLQDQSLIDLMSNEDWQKLAKTAEEHDIPPFMAAKMQPWFLSLSLAVPPCMMSKLKQSAGGLDSQLNDIANEAQVPTQSLESTDTLFQIFKQEPMEEQIDFMMAGLMPRQSSQDALVTTFSAYYSENIAEGWQINRILTPDLVGMSSEEADVIFAELNVELLENRNKAWIPVILDAVSEYDAPIVAAFGAAHLMGENGVLNLLAQQGFTLERQEF